MIRNLVFDLGNVLLSWNPGDYLIKSGFSEERTKLILDTVFKSSEWLSLDNGDISKDEAIERMASGSSLKRAEISSLFDLCIDILYPITSNVKLLPALKKRGYRLYYLSNYPIDFFLATKSRYSFFDFFDGGIISAEVRFSKPDPEIYNILLGRYGLNAGESLFIDDIYENVEAAISVGMKGLFTGGNHNIASALCKIINCPEAVTGKI